MALMWGIDCIYFSIEQIEKPAEYFFLSCESLREKHVDNEFPPGARREPNSCLTQSELSARWL